MLIFAACYQFHSLSLSPQNYKSVVSTAPFIHGVTAGDNYAQEARWGTYFRSSQEATGSSVLEGSTTDYTGGCSLATGSFWGLFTEPPPVSRHHRGLWRSAKTRHKGGWEFWRMGDERRECLPLPSVLFSDCAVSLQPASHISGLKKMSFSFSDPFFPMGEIRIDPKNRLKSFCTAETGKLSSIIFSTNIFVSLFKRTMSLFSNTKTPLIKRRRRP